MNFPESFLGSGLSFRKSALHISMLGRNKFYLGRILSWKGWLLSIYSENVSYIVCHTFVLLSTFNAKMLSWHEKGYLMVWQRMVSNLKWTLSILSGRK